MKNWWILVDERPCGARPFIYEGYPPNQTVELCWIEEEERYCQAPWQEASACKFNSEFEAVKYMKEMYPHNMKELRIIRRNTKLKLF